MMRSFTFLRLTPELLRPAYAATWARFMHRMANNSARPPSSGGVPSAGAGGGGGGGGGRASAGLTPLTPLQRKCAQHLPSPSLLMIPF
jgi:hypothetical protein